MHDKSKLGRFISAILERISRLIPAGLDAMLQYPARQGLPAILTYLGALIALGVLIGNLGDFFLAIGNWIAHSIRSGQFESGADVATASNAFWISGPAMIVMAFAAIRTGNRRRPEPEREVMVPHRGLIVNLSKFNHQVAFDELSEPENFTPEFLERLKKTNWGTIFKAVDFHSRELEHLWVIVTPNTDAHRGSQDEFPSIKPLLAHYFPNIKVHEEVGSSVSSETHKDAVVRAYNHARKLLLDSSEIVADMTGGTAASSVGMAFAAIDEDRKLQYFAQDTLNIVHVPVTRRSLPPE